MKRILALVVMSIALWGCDRATETATSQTDSVQDPLVLAQQLAASELQRRGDGLSYGGWDIVRERDSKWSYTTGLLMEAMDDVATATGETQFADYARQLIDPLQRRRLSSPDPDRYHPKQEAAELAAILEGAARPIPGR